MYVVCKVDHHEDRDRMLKLNYRGDQVLLFDYQVFMQEFPLQLSKYVWMVKVGEDHYCISLKHQY